MALASRSGHMHALQQQRAAAPCAPRPAARAAPARARAAVVPRADRSDGGWMAGFVMGGVVFGTLGFLFAPQISRALLTEDQRLRLPRFMEEEAPKDPETTKQELIDKIAQLNASIDEVAAQLKPKGEAEVVTAELS